MSEQVLHALELDLALAELEVDRLLLAAVDLRRLEGLDEVERLRDPRLQLDKGFLRVLVLRHLDAGEARDRALGGIARDLHLALHGKHVRVEAEIGEHDGLDLPRLGVRLRLVENRGKVLEDVGEARDAYLVHGNGHDVLRRWARGRSAARSDRSYLTICRKMSSSPTTDPTHDRVRSH